VPEPRPDPPVPPTLEAPRLVLRPFHGEDAAETRRLAGDRRIADTTAAIPHPYPEGLAETWIATHAARYAARLEVTFAVTERDGGALVGACGLMVARVPYRAELGYWIAPDRWGRGYATEAARAVVAFGFETWGLARIEASHFLRNPASGRVLEKIGMRREGVLRGYFTRWGVAEDSAMHGILAGDPRP
jgi:ribosomal-protein-alanine N-acetyltransferase